MRKQGVLRHSAHYYTKGTFGSAVDHHSLRDINSDRGTLFGTARSLVKPPCGTGIGRAQPKTEMRQPNLDLLRSHFIFTLRPLANVVLRKPVKSVVVTDPVHPLGRTFSAAQSESRKRQSGRATAGHREKTL